MGVGTNPLWQAGRLSGRRPVTSQVVIISGAAPVPGRLDRKFEWLGSHYQ